MASTSASTAPATASTSEHSSASRPRMTSLSRCRSRTLWRSVAHEGGSRPSAVARLSSCSLLSRYSPSLAGAPGRVESGKPGGGGIEEGVQRPRGDRRGVVVVADHEAAPLPLETDLARFEHPAVVVAENREQHHVAQLGLGGIPVHVEVRGVDAGGPVFEDIPPPGVLPPGDRHVVRNDVEDLAQAGGPERRAHPGMALGAPELPVDVGGVDHVVAVRAARRGLQIGRSVQMGHTQVAQVPGDRRHLVETEAGAELHPIGRQQRSPGPGAASVSSIP